MIDDLPPLNSDDQFGTDDVGARQVSGPLSHFGMIGQSQPMLALFENVIRIAGTPSDVVIHGESGTGKELVARALHKNSPRAGGPFVAWNCAGIAPTLLDSALFGHERGAFTDARERSIGLFERASGGTLFLDEIGDMPLELQPKLLRVLQERCLTRLGGQGPISVDVRVLCATHRDLKQLVKSGQFRDDLFYRLRVVEVSIPPLRERAVDIPLLAQHFLKKHEEKYGKKDPYFDSRAMSLIRTHHYPGNVRELENVVKHALTKAQSNTITVDDLPEYIRGISETGGALVEGGSLRGRLASKVVVLRGTTSLTVQRARNRLPFFWNDHQSGTNELSLLEWAAAYLVSCGIPPPMPSYPSSRSVWPMVVELLCPPGVDCANKDPTKSRFGNAAELPPNDVAALEQLLGPDWAAAKTRREVIKALHCLAASKCDEGPCTAAEPADAEPLEEFPAVCTEDDPSHGDSVDESQQPEAKTPVELGRSPIFWRRTAVIGISLALIVAIGFAGLALYAYSNRDIHTIVVESKPPNRHTDPTIFIDAVIASKPQYEKWFLEDPLPGLLLIHDTVIPSLAVDCPESLEKRLKSGGAVVATVIHPDAQTCKLRGSELSDANFSHQRFVEYVIENIEIYAIVSESLPDSGRIRVFLYCGLPSSPMYAIVSNGNLSWLKNDWNGEIIRDWKGVLYFSNFLIKPTAGNGYHIKVVSEIRNAETVEMNPIWEAFIKWFTRKVIVNKSMEVDLQAFMVEYRMCSLLQPNHTKSCMLEWIRHRYPLIQCTNIALGDYPIQGMNE